MKTIRRRRPEVEGLESMMLLSGAAGAAVPAAVSGPIALTGSDHGTYTTKGFVSMSKGSGSISPLGHVTDKGSASLAVGEGTDTLSAKRGKLFVDLRVVGRTATGYSETYTIAGGTKEYAGATGSGHAQLSFIPTSTTHGKFTTIYG